MRRYLLVLAALAGLGWAPVPRNPADRVAGPVDPLAYEPARRCLKRPGRGTLLLQRWLERHVRGASWGTVRCERWGPGRASAHAEGRAIDWHLDARVGADRRAAARLIGLLLAPDRSGEPFALARRMGIQGIIWNCAQWYGGGDALGPYRYCYDNRGRRKQRLDRTQAHADHVHLELTRAGAAGRTSFWRRHTRD